MTTLSQFFPSGSSSGGGDTIPATTTVAEVLLVGGGGSGSKICAANPAYTGTGGSAGGVLISHRYCFEQGCSYTITIGSGGAVTPYSLGCDGSPSSIVGYGVSLTAYGAYCNGQHNFTNQINEYTTHYGNPKGVPRFTSPSPSLNVGGAGGGGATARGTDAFSMVIPSGATCVEGGDAGHGIISTISGGMAYYGGGGGGGASNYPGPFVAKNSCGGIGGGGPANPYVGISGCVNTGGGGGGGNGPISCGGAGGSGVLFIRYPDTYRAAPSTSGNTPTPAQSGCRVYRWNGSGSITF